MFPVARADRETPAIQAIRTASQRSGVSFDYLVRTAQRESSLDPAARAPTSTAAGLFQFLEGTWLQTLKEDGPALGFTRQAEAIERRADGRFVVADPEQRRDIMAMRFDPEANAVLAAAFTQRNAQTLQASLGRAPTEGELYAAHFLGASGAVRLISLAQQQPTANAVEAFPEAADANRRIFRTRDGRPRSVADVLQQVTARHTDRPVALAAQEISSDAPPRAVPGQDGPLFHTLFAPEGRGPVSQTVQALWGRGTGGAVSAELTRQPFFPSAARGVDAPFPGQPVATVAAAPQVPVPPERPDGARPARRIGAPLDLLAPVRARMVRG